MLTRGIVRHVFTREEIPTRTLSRAAKAKYAAAPEQIADMEYFYWTCGQTLDEVAVTINRLYGTNRSGDSVRRIFQQQGIRRRTASETQLNRAKRVRNGFS